MSNESFVIENYAYKRERKIILYLMITHSNVSITVNQTFHWKFSTTQTRSLAHQMYVISRSNYQTRTIISIYLLKLELGKTRIGQVMSLTENQQLVIVPFLA